MTKQFLHSTIFCLLFSVNLFGQGTYPSSCVPRPFNNTEFNLNGSTNFQAPGVFELTPNTGNSWGSVWYRRRLDLRVNFRISVDLFLGNSNSPGADGIGFVLQNLDTGQGGAGGGLGFGGTTPADQIRPSVAIEFDTYYNPGIDPASQSDHIAFIIDGNMAALPPTNDITDVNNLENGNFHSVTITWDPDTQVFAYEFTHSDGTVYSNSKTYNIVGHLGGNIAFWGFTAATGGQSNIHSVRFNDNSICVVDATTPVVLGNNYSTTTGTASLTADEISYFCTQFAPEFFNTAYHNGENTEPAVGDFLIYNNLKPIPQGFVSGSDFAYMKMRDYNKIIVVRKSDGEVVAVYNCP